MVSKKRSSRKSDGRSGSFVIGSSAFEKISAIEGIRPSEASRARAAEFDRRDVPIEERIREIIRVHRPER